MNVGHKGIEQNASIIKPHLSVIIEINGANLEDSKREIFKMHHFFNFHNGKLIRTIWMGNF